ncbi:MAG TPA: MarR family transcriptional regulator [Polyangia bacterium]|nr:MarR family transcriptional regulator [Polyangia bacterium]
MSRIQDKRFEASVAHAVTRLFREQNRRYGRVVEPFGVSAEQAHLLALLWAHGGALTMTELGAQTALSSGTLSAAVDRMEAAGLARRLPDPDDKRGVRVEAARWPAARRERLVRALLATEDELLAPLSPRERRALAQLIERVLAGLDAPPRRG